MRDKPAGITNGYEQAVRNAFDVQVLAVVL